MLNIPTFHQYNGETKPDCEYGQRLWKLKDEVPGTRI